MMEPHRENPIGVTWSSRENPLTPSAVVAVGSTTTQRLYHRLLSRDSQPLESLEFVAYQVGLLVIGHHRLLPWVDGAIYLGQESNSSLLVPTTHKPDIPVQILERAFKAKFSTLNPPMVALPSVPCILSAAAPIAASIESLEAHLRELP